jgi:integrase/recombinase XerD
VPLWKATAASLRVWRAHIDPAPDAPVFPNRTGQPLSRSGVEHRLQVALATACKRCPSLADRHVSPHTLRHSTAMHLLQSRVDITVIALWLGHEDTATTHLYIEADLAMKTAALDRLGNPGTRPIRFKPPDDLLAFLNKL